MAVIDGTSYTVVMDARRETSNAYNANCNGTLRVEIKGSL